MAHVPGLRSPYDRVGRLVYFGRMIDKIRLHINGQLPADYHGNLGRGFDTRCARFLGVKYEEIVTRAKQGGTDQEILSWCEAKGGERSNEDCEVWNSFMVKRGWRDSAEETLRQRITESGLGDKPIMTFFDLIEFDEGRDSVTAKSWL